jgi:heparanase 1
MHFKRQVVAIVIGVPAVVAAASAPPAALSPARMARLGTVDERFSSYNVEMVEVTGGRFWKPYASTVSTSATATANSELGGLPADLFEYRPPIDLANPRLRTLAAALGPAYVRVSGSWANTVYFHDADGPAPADPPAGFRAVLTRPQWKGVVDFVRAVGGQLVTSFAFGAGNRDAAGVWTPAQARKLVAYTKAVGGRIAAAEFVNEPNLAAIGGAPRGYDAAGFARDVAVFRPFFTEAAPRSLFLGPGSVAEGGPLDRGSTPGRLRTEDLLQATSPAFDAFSYHIYGAVSQRCARVARAAGTTAEAARSREWLSRPEAITAFYAELRDRFEPGKPLWVTETADAACGGNPWASTFLDTFRYLTQHGRLAQKGVQVIAHNTLAASDYGLLDEKTFAPRPNYWAALLWRRLMGRVVLDPGPSPAADVYTYAHCLRDHPGGVTLLAVNAGTAPADLDLAADGERYTLTAKELQGTAVELNGSELHVNGDGALPRIGGAPTRAGRLTLPPASATFVAFPKAGNRACR